MFKLNKMTKGATAKPVPFVHCAIESHQIFLLQFKLEEDGKQIGGTRCASFEYKGNSSFSGSYLKLLAGKTISGIWQYLKVVRNNCIRKMVDSNPALFREGNPDGHRGKHLLMLHLPIGSLHEHRYMALRLMPRNTG